MHIFIAGVMQGSRLDDQIHEQDYRLRITEAIRDHIPEAHISDPWALDPGSVDYDAQRARETFVKNTALAGEADVVIAYLPHASMGTAIELWTAYQRRAYVVAVTPMQHNWVVQITADEVLPDLESLLGYIESGRLTEQVNLHMIRRLPVDAQDAAV